MSHFCKRHYQAVAAILRDESRDPKNDPATLAQVREAFSNHFARDNSKYDRDRFMVAATPTTPATR